MAAARMIAEPTGLRLCGMVEEPPRPGPEGSSDFGDFGLRHQRDIARHFAQRADQQTESGGHFGQAVAMRVPREIGQVQLQFARERGGDGQAAVFRARPACPPRRQTAAPEPACAIRLAVRDAVRWRRASQRL